MPNLIGASAPVREIVFFFFFSWTQELEIVAGPRDKTNREKYFLVHIGGDKVPLLVKVILLGALQDD